MAERPGRWERFEAWSDRFDSRVTRWIPWGLASLAVIHLVLALLSAFGGDDVPGTSVSVIAYVGVAAGFAFAAAQRFGIGGARWTLLTTLDFGALVLGGLVLSNRDEDGELPAFAHEAWFDPALILVVVGGALILIASVCSRPSGVAGD